MVTLSNILVAIFLSLIIIGILSAIFKSKRKPSRSRPQLRTLSSGHKSNATDSPATHLFNKRRYREAATTFLKEGKLFLATKSLACLGPETINEIVTLIRRKSPTNLNAILNNLAEEMYWQEKKYATAATLLRVAGNHQRAEAIETVHGIQSTERFIPGRKPEPDFDQNKLRETSRKVSKHFFNKPEEQSTFVTSSTKLPVQNSDVNIGSNKDNGDSLPSATFQSSANSILPESKNTLIQRPDTTTGSLSKQQIPEQKQAKTASQSSSPVSMMIKPTISTLKESKEFSNKLQIATSNLSSNCLVCSLKIQTGEVYLNCLSCGRNGHKSHILEWAKVIGKCKTCNVKLSKRDFDLE